MLRYVLLLMLAAPLQSPTPESVATTLDRARQLYVEARFKEAIDLLAPLDSALSSQPKRTSERINLKLQIALAHIGLNQTPQARSRFTEICTLDPNYSLDATKFAPKVISLFEDAKAEHAKAQCEMICMKADQLLEMGQTEELLALIQPARSICACVESVALDAASYFLKTGMDAYKKEDLNGALRNFRIASQFDSDGSLAGSYLDLVRNRLKLAAQQLFLEWQTEFEANQFDLAAATYHRLETANVEGSATEALDNIRTRYRSHVSDIASSWKKACSSGDGITMNKLRGDAAQTLPDPSLAQDLLSEMAVCTAAKAGCVQLNTETMMGRVRRRQAAKLPAGVAPRPAPRNFDLTVQAKVRVDEKGNVFLVDPESVDPKIRNSVVTAANRWKFAPTVIDKKARCVETTIPIALQP